MRDVVYERLRDLLGEPNRPTVKDWRWEFSIGLSVVLEKETKVATVWLPWPFDGWRCPEYGEIYAADRGRSAATYPMRNMEHGQHVLRLRLDSTSAINETMQRISTVKGR